MANTARTFTASLKPAWNYEKMVEFCNKMKGVAVVFVINHDKDADTETGEIKEIHTHILLEYETPRKITTVANLLEVESNFIVLVKSPKSMLKYLTHQDDPEKAQYEASEVVTNSQVSYNEMILGQSLSDKEIARYITEGRGIDLLGVVSASKLRTIQAFLSFDTSGRIYSELRSVNEKLDHLNAFVDKVEVIVSDLATGTKKTIAQLVIGLDKIGSEIEKVRKNARPVAKLHS